MSLLPLFIGTYTTKGGKGIYALSFDSTAGTFTTPEIAAETPNPTYLTLSPDRTKLYAVAESATLAVAFAIDSDRAQLTPLAPPLPSISKPAAHIAIDATGRLLVLSFYHSGLVAAVPVNADGTLAPPSPVIRHTGSSIDPERQTAPHPHSATISPDNRRVFVCDLGLDKIFNYRLRLASASLAPAEPPFITNAPGAGPRHMAFSPDGRHAFMISEMGATLTAYRYDPEQGSLIERDTRSTLPADFRGENKSAAVRVHPNGRFVYASNRGPETLVAFTFDDATGQLSLVQTIASGGAHPRDFALSPDGRWLIAAHQDSNSLTAFRVDPDTGQLTALSARAEIPAPVCVLFV